MIFSICSFWCDSFMLFNDWLYFACFFLFIAYCEVFFVIQFDWLFDYTNTYSSSSYYTLAADAFDNWNVVNIWWGRKFMYFIQCCSFALEYSIPGDILEYLTKYWRKQYESVPNHTKQRSCWWKCVYLIDKFMRCSFSPSQNLTI